MVEKHELKANLIGEDENMGKSGVYLKRILEWTDDGSLLHPDHQHAHTLVKSYGMKSCKPAPTPYAREDEVDAERSEMEEPKARIHRGGVDRLVYLAQDRMDLSMAACKLASSIARPRGGRRDPVEKRGPLLARTTGIHTSASMPRAFTNHDSSER